MIGFFRFVLVILLLTVVAMTVPPAFSSDTVTPASATPAAVGVL